MDVGQHLGWQAGKQAGRQLGKANGAAGPCTGAKKREGCGGYRAAAHMVSEACFARKRLVCCVRRAVCGVRRAVALAGDVGRSGGASRDGGGRGWAAEASWFVHGRRQPLPPRRAARMSTSYNLEPTPTAKVLLHTTAGALELELFAKQTPVTSRNFLQLCLDGYYDHTVFHRLVPGFILQGGDPTGTGQGGESSYDGEPFADEVHSRLKYTRRGLLGMANTGKKDDNGSQFFFTLAATPELQERNTMFGRVAGDTIYNLMKMAEAELREGSDDQPMYPTKITAAEIIVNPFEDMVPRPRVAARTASDEKKAKKPKRKAGKNVLSFGDDDGAEPAPVAKKAKYNAKLVSASDAAPTAAAPATSMPIRKPARKSPLPSPSPQPAPKAVPTPRPREKTQAVPEPPRELSPESEKRAKLDRVNAQIAELKASMKRTTGAQAAEPAKKKSLLEAMVPSSTTRGRKRGTGVMGTAQEQATLDVLSKFKSKLETADPAAVPRPTTPELTVDTSPGNGHVDSGKPADEEEAACDLHFIVGCQSCTAWDNQEGEESDDDAGWMAHSLSFAKDRLGKNLEWKRKNEEELLVIDPLEEAKRHKADAKGKREWDDPKGKKKIKS
jgi:peptidyl-prolyl cis-trans isomerase SDCCAG10